MRLGFASLLPAALALLSHSTASAQEVHVRVELVEVRCGNTEDVTGADDFYVVGAFTSNGKDTKSTITTPFKINDKQTKTFADAERVLFDGKIPAKESVRGGLTAFDEDAAADWKKHKDDASKITNAVSGVLGSSTNPYAVGAAAILKGSFEAWNALAPLDKDDELGKRELTIPAEGKPEEVLEWKLERKAKNLIEKYSDWEYTVKYRVTRTKS